MDVGLGDAAHGGLQDLDLHLGMLELGELLADGLDRAADVGPQDDVQRLHLVLWPSRSKRFSRVTCGRDAAQLALPGVGRAAARPVAGPG